MSKQMANEWAAIYLDPQKLYSRKTVKVKELETMDNNNIFASATTITAPTTI